MSNSPSVPLLSGNDDPSQFLIGGEINWASIANLGEPTKDAYALSSSTAAALASSLSSSAFAFNEEPPEQLAVASKRRWIEEPSQPSSPSDWEMYISTNRPYCSLYDSHQIEMSNSIGFNVTIDKLLNKESFSPPDHAYILYRQNHMKVDCEVTGLLSHYSTPAVDGHHHAQMQPPFYVDDNGLLVPVHALYCHIYAVQQPMRSNNNSPSAQSIEEQQEQVIELLQIEGSNRKKETKVPELVTLHNGTASYPKLQFRTATPNNARLNPLQPNPNQQYYRLVSSLIAVTTYSDNTNSVHKSFHFISSKISPYLIVRGQNPGKFKNAPASPEECSKSPPTKSQRIASPQGEMWNQNVVDQSLYAYGKIGINTAEPQEALSVHGNVLVTGDILKPSDVRRKFKFQEVDPSLQLANIEKLKLYDYELVDSGQQERGVIAQELQQVMPNAVRVVGSVKLNDNLHIPNMLVVNDRALLLENIGATQALGNEIRNEKQTINSLVQQINRLSKEEHSGAYSLKELFRTLLEFILSEHSSTSVDTSMTCCYFSMFGLGPSWTLFLLGFFCMPFLWIFGSFYLGSAQRVQRVAGIANFIALIVYTPFVISVAVVLELPLMLGLLVGCVPGCGVVLLTIIGIIWQRRKNKRRMDAEFALLKLQKLLDMEARAEEARREPV